MEIKNLSYDNLDDELPFWSAPFGLTLLDTIRIRHQIQVLDIGSGGGFPMLEIAERLGTGSFVFGLDPSVESARMIRQKIQRNAITNAAIVQGVSENIPFPDQYFDLIVSNNGLNNVNDLTLSLAECFRVSKKGAQMVYTMNLPHTMTEFYDVFANTLSESGLHEEIVKLEEYIQRKRKPVDYIKQRIIDSGIMVKSIQIEGFKYRFASGEALFSHHFMQTAFLPHWKAIVPDNMAENIFTVVIRKLNAIADKKNELVMSVPFVCFDCLKI